MIVQISYKENMSDRVFFCEDIHQDLNRYQFVDVQPVEWNPEDKKFDVKGLTAPTVLYVYIDSIVQVEISE